MNAIDDIVRTMAIKWAEAQSDALEAALGVYRDEYGRFPAYAWLDTPSSAASMMFPTEPSAVVIHCGEERPTGPGARSVWLTGLLNATGVPTGRDYVEDIGRGAGYAVNPAEISFDCPKCGATVTHEEETWYDGAEIEWMCSAGHWGYGELDVVVMARASVELGEDDR